ncbi:hypothetical protein L3Q82_006201 [Scortum barcoo]|uniref:Uncharacterized protein n=1 Tax=Scortum barcoo TaxID=214431 RepID=A0ACB8X2P8_9TELE|nr:hypothetical protein L3Q82_006201 [Scortum barcoo]
MLLPAATKALGIKGIQEDLPLRTVRQDIQVFHGHKVSFHVSPAGNPKMDELYRHVERLWRVDTVHHRPEQEVTRSKQDQQAVSLMDAKTVRIEVDGVRRERADMQKLIGAGAVQEVTPEKAVEECWYILYHLVAHNGKHRLVFNCSHQYLGQTLNQY